LCIFLINQPRCSSVCLSFSVSSIFPVFCFESTFLVPFFFFFWVSGVVCFCLVCVQEAIVVSASSFSFSLLCCWCVDIAFFFLFSFYQFSRIMEPMAGEWTSAAHSMGVIFCLCLCLRERSLHLLLELFFCLCVCFLAVTISQIATEGFNRNSAVQLLSLMYYLDHHLLLLLRGSCTLLLYMP
jgi:hypothetical protein